jgi:hypothetical protein
MLKLWAPRKNTRTQRRQGFFMVEFIILCDLAALREQ